MQRTQRITSKTIEAVKTNIDILTIIGDYVSLKKRGRNFIGLCPFHSEKTPSFTVSPDKKIYHCFGCHQSGDAIGFVMDVDQLSFTQAIEHIAKKVGISIEYEQQSPEQQAQAEKIDLIVTALVEAKQLFQYHLSNSTEAQSYCEKRHINAESIHQFSIGYSPEINYLEALRKKGISNDTLIQSGLAFQTESQEIIPRFRGRIMFPVLDYRGRTVGFGGRVIQAGDKVPKYLNSPETVVFNKSRLMYGLVYAKKEISQLNSCLLVEGYLDVIMAHQYGIKHAVATMGTALTGAHIQKLQRFCSQLTLAMDDDAAGQAAVLKSIGLLNQYKVNAQVMNLETLDPADYLIQNGPDMFKTQLNRALPLIDFKLEQLMRTSDLSKITIVRDIVDELVPLIQDQGDEIIKRHYIGLVSKKLAIDIDIVATKVNQVFVPSTSKRIVSKPVSKTRFQKAQEFILFAMANKAIYRQQAALQLKDYVFDQPEYKALFDALLTMPDAVDSVSDVSDSTLQPLLSRLLIEQEIRDDRQFESQFNDCLASMFVLPKKQRISELKARIKEFEGSGKEGQATELYKELTQLLSQKGDVND